MSLSDLLQPLKEHNPIFTRGNDVLDQPQDPAQVKNLQAISKHSSNAIEDIATHTEKFARFFYMAVQDNAMDTVNQCDLEVFGFFIESQMNTLMELKALHDEAEYYLKRHKECGGSNE